MKGVNEIVVSMCFCKSLAMLLRSFPNSRATWPSGAAAGERSDPARSFRVVVSLLAGPGGASGWKLRPGAREPGNGGPSESVGRGCPQPVGQSCHGSPGLYGGGSEIQESH